MVPKLMLMTFSRLFSGADSWTLRNLLTWTWRMHLAERWLIRLLAHLRMIWNTLLVLQSMTTICQGWTALITNHLNHLMMMSLNPTRNPPEHQHRRPGRCQLWILPQQLSMNLLDPMRIFSKGDFDLIDKRPSSLGPQDNHDIEPVWHPMKSPRHLRLLPNLLHCHKYQFHGQSGKRCFDRSHTVDLLDSCKVHMWPVFCGATTPDWCKYCTNDRMPQHSWECICMDFESSSGTHSPLETLTLSSINLFFEFVDDRDLFIRVVGKIMTEFNVQQPSSAITSYKVGSLGTEEAEGDKKWIRIFWGQEHVGPDDREQWRDHDLWWL